MLTESLKPVPGRCPAFCVCCAPFVRCARMSACGVRAGHVCGVPRIMVGGFPFVVSSGGAPRGVPPHPVPQPCNVFSPEAPFALEMEEPAQARATPKRRREEGFTADVKAHAVERFRANGDAAAAARATEEHFASQHRVFRLYVKLVCGWAQAGAGELLRFKTNARGGLLRMHLFCFALVFSGLLYPVGASLAACGGWVGPKAC